MTAPHPIPDAALEHHLAVLGKTGAGKSYAAQGLVERLIAAGRRVCVIDPTDRYWGLRLAADGRGPSGLEVAIFGGAHGDLPLAPEHGAALAGIVGTTTTPAVIVTRLLTVGERTRFFTDFAETLLRRNEGALHLVLDEAHLFAPQTRVASVESGRMLHAATNLVSLGRGIGLRIMLLTQRPAKLHKDALTQVESLAALRLIAPQDRGAIEDWVREWADPATGREMMASLPALPTGTAWFWAPELDLLRRIAFPPIATFDSGRPPQPGAKGPQLAPIDMAAIRERLRIVAKEAIENDPGRLRARIAELEKALRAKAQPTADDETLRQLRETAYRDGYGAGWREARAAATDRERTLLAAIRAAAAYLAPLAVVERDGVRQLDTRKPPAPPVIDSAPLKPRRRAVLPPSATNGAAVPLSGGERRILTVLAQYPDGRSKRQIALLTGYAINGGAFGNYLGGLRSKGFMTGGNSEVMRATPEGLAALGPFEPLPRGRALLDHWLNQLGKAPRLILEHLASRHPQTVDRRELAAATGYQAEGGGFGNALSRLRTLQLIEGKNAFRAADDLFEASP